MSTIEEMIKTDVKSDPNDVLGSNITNIKIVYTHNH